MSWLIRRFVAGLITEQLVGAMLGRACDLLDRLVARTHTTLDDAAAREVRRVLTNPAVVAWVTATLLAVLSGGPVPPVPDVSTTRAAVAPN